ncbi:unnamed protein product [Nezara viridula]|uniref:Uncharacterized protein n=1 Tax=Nezara viridula TaxID=85310 RepID=A0A9P0E7B4_NEZVI|nr:unnamed protein product [Nezara viridula]
MGITWGKPLGKPKPYTFNTYFFHADQPFLTGGIKAIWESKEVTVSIPPNPEDALCEDHFINTCTRDLQGRFVISFPFRSDQPIAFDSTRKIALHRFRNLENRFRRDPEYKTAYAAIMDEMEAVKGASNMGRGKDIANIVEAEKKTAQIDETANVEEEPKSEDEEQGENWRAPVVPLHL